MNIYTLAELEMYFSEILDRAANGEAFIITKEDEPAFSIRAYQGSATDSV